MNNGMKYSKIEENNILIAKFMGITVRKRFLWYGVYNVDGELLTTSWTENQAWRLIANSIKFHSSWDWLMPVVDKIENLNYDVQIGSGMFCRIWDIDPDRLNYDEEHSSPKRIQCVYLAIIDFIKWYNGQNEEIPL